jgi:hypothetical protein
MSQSAYPSFVWQTYDYYYDLNGAYWGVKKACEPVHIQWSYADNSVKVSNTTLNNLTNLQAVAIVYNMDGKRVAKYGVSAKVNAAANTISDCFTLNFTTDNMVFSKHAVASSVGKDALDAGAVTDGSNGSRWSSNYNDDEWIYVDLGQQQEIASVVLDWESAYGKAYKLLVSDDAKTWKEIYATSNGKGGSELIEFTPLKTRYVKMQGIKRATEWGYSLFEFGIYGKSKKVDDLTPVHFIKLLLKDQTGKLLSDNFYWRGGRTADYSNLNKLPKAKLSASSKLVTANGRSVINATIKNTGEGVAFAIHLQAVRVADGERILPAIANDDYFTLMKGETKKIEIEFDQALLKDGKYKLLVEPYNR